MALLLIIEKSRLVAKHSKHKHAHALTHALTGDLAQARVLDPANALSA
jgi:hypothetical protein